MRLDGDKFVIEGLASDAVKVISFSDLLPNQSRDIWSVVAHRLDLNFAKTCLNLVASTENSTQMALWRIAVLYYCKCFSQTAKKGRASARGGRKPLNSGRTLPAGLPREIHSYFMSMRNMHFMHDQNPWLQTLAGAVIAGPGRTYNIEKVICSTHEGDTLNQANFGNLSLLVDHALEWTAAEFDKLCANVTQELEKIDKQTLLAQREIQYRAPEAADIHASREELRSLHR